MQDIELYQDLSQILFNEAPRADSEINSFTKIVDGSCGFSFWVTSLRKGNTFTLSSDGMIEFNSKVLSLNSYFAENSLGKWNTMLLSVSPDGKFTTNFEFSQELENRVIPFWKFLKRFD